MTTESDIYFSTEKLLLRVFFLRQTELSLHFLSRATFENMDPNISTLLLQTALETDVPKIQEAFLARSAEDLSEATMAAVPFRVLDPESIDWTPGLRHYFAWRLSVRQSADGWTFAPLDGETAALVGYLRLVPFRAVLEKVKAYPNSLWGDVLMWHIKALLREDPQRNGAIPEIEDLLISDLVRRGRDIERRIVKTGYLSPNLHDANRFSDLFSALRAEELLRFSPVGVMVFVSRLDYSYIGRETVRRARLLLAAIESGRILPARHMRAFLPELQILAGAVVSSAKIDERANRLAWTVGHPAADNGPGGEVEAVIRSNVKFDILHLAKLPGSVPGDIEPLLPQLAGYGELYPAMAISQKVREAVLADLPDIFTGRVSRRPELRRSNEAYIGKLRKYGFAT